MTGRRPTKPRRIPWGQEGFAPGLRAAAERIVAAIAPQIVAKVKRDR